MSSPSFPARLLLRRDAHSCNKRLKERNRPETGCLFSYVENENENEKRLKMCSIPECLSEGEGRKTVVQKCYSSFTRTTGGESVSQVVLATNNDLFFFFFFLLFFYDVLCCHFCNDANYADVYMRFSPILHPFFTTTRRCLQTFVSVSLLLSACHSGCREEAVSDKSFYFLFSVVPMGSSPSPGYERERKDENGWELATAKQIDTRR